jgi:hypothetical protein
MASFQRIDDPRDTGVFAGHSNLPLRQFAQTLGILEGFPK